jgi:serine/threonine-protein kinase
MTETGLSLGTPHYMSPEQATAEKEISARSDVYSLASVLYEMLTGDPPHTGSSAQQVIMKIISETAEAVTTYRKAVPPNVAAAVGKALEKLPADRFESAEAFGAALANPGFTTATASAMAIHPTTARGWLRSPFSWATLAVAAAALAGLGYLATRPEAPRPVSRLDLDMGGIPSSQFGTGGAAISTDGSMVAVAGQRDGIDGIYLRHLDGDPEFRFVAGTERGRSPTFSPDGQYLAFSVPGDSLLVKVLVDGGGAVPLVKGTYRPTATRWGEDDRIVFLSDTRPYLIDAGGGTPIEHGGENAPWRDVALLPDGSGILGHTPRGVVLHDLAADSATVLVAGARYPSYAATGHLLYIDEGGGLFAVAFDLDRHEITGDPIRVVDRVRDRRGDPGYAVSPSGVLVVVDGESESGAVGMTSTLVLATLGGPVDTIKLPTGRRENPRFSPNGEAIAYELFNDGGRTDLQVFNLVSLTTTTLTFVGDNDDPVWSPDGTRIVFNRDAGESTGEDLYLQVADGSDSARRLMAMPESQWPQAWPDESTIVFGTRAGGQADLLITSPVDSAATRVYQEAPWSEYDFDLSPDGQLAAYVSEEGGRDQVWVRDFPVARGKWLVPGSDGAGQPRWATDGKAIYFWKLRSGQDTLLVARVDRAPQVVIHDPVPVPGLPPVVMRGWDLAPDGQRLVVSSVLTPTVAGTSEDQSAADGRYLVTINWFEELKARMGLSKAAP